MTRFLAPTFRVEGAELVGASPTKAGSGLRRSRELDRLYRLGQVALALIGGDEMWRQLWAAHYSSMWAAHYSSV